MAPTKAEVKRLVTALMECVRGIERAKRTGLASQLALLQVIAARKSAPLSALSQEMGLHLSSITRQTQVLSRDGLVKLTVNPADGRSRLVELTRAGRAELDRLIQLGLDRFALFVQDWESSEVQALAGLLEKFEASKSAASKRFPPPTRRHARRSEE